MVLYSTSGDSVIKIGQTHNPFKKMKKGTYRLLFSDIFIICGSRNNFYFLQNCLNMLVFYLEGRGLALHFL